MTPRLFKYVVVPGADPRIWSRLGVKVGTTDWGFEGCRGKWVEFYLLDKPERRMAISKMDWKTDVDGFIRGRRVGDDGYSIILLFKGVLDHLYQFEHPSISSGGGTVVRFPRP